MGNAGGSKDSEGVRWKQNGLDWGGGKRKVSVGEERIGKEKVKREIEEC